MKNGTKNAGAYTIARTVIAALILVLCAAVPVQGRAALYGALLSKAALYEATLSPRHDPAKVQAAMRGSAKSLGLQTQIPEGKQIDPEEDPLDWFIPRWNMSGGAKFLFYVSLLAIAAVVIMTWRDNLWSASRARRFERGAKPGSPDAQASERMSKAQLEADDLAARDDFAEAMHVLLLRSVDELRRRLGVTIAASLTSREIQREIGLPPEGRRAFADIIDRVEASYFGTHLPGADDYAACRSSFDSLTRILRQFSIQ